MQKLLTHIQQLRSHRGFTLLLAVLVASLMLILAGSMFNLVQKEVILSSVGRDSEIAFYTADGALECALYWDFQQQAFNNVSGGPPIVCNGTTVTVTRNAGATAGSVAFPGISNPPDPMEFQFDSNGYCAKVSVTKSANYPRTTIDARGYNASCSAIGSNLRALERAVEVNY